MLRRLVSVGKGRVWHRSLASNKQKQQVSTPVIGVGEELPKVDPLSISTEGEPVRQIDTRLRPRHRILIEGGIPPVEFEWEKKRTARRQRFGQFGLASGVNLEELWPTVEEIEEEEAIGMYRELQAVLQEHKQLVAERKKTEAARDKEIQANIKKYPAMLKKYEASQIKAEKEKDEKELTLERRIREIHEYFGYWLDPKDPRFGVMLQQKEAEEKKAEKMAKRAEKEKKKFADIV
ncbi:hypothetical protein WR25_06375 [Diploscapter pachys]|uniref:Large ribosomal subunit protein mL64 n=1 Tax=Diploscapter pachys TaxID=2018661 RepID=A0A2A2KM47_9BILA|nr:hypothetical protein WR25_06375 [Diploscapter pachys]